MKSKRENLKSKSEKKKSKSIGENVKKKKKKTKKCTFEIYSQIKGKKKILQR